MASTPSLKRSDTIADSMPDALKQSRYYMKKCFARFVAQGKRLMKAQNIMKEVDQSIPDVQERSKVLEGLLGYILTSTQEAAVVPPCVAMAIRPNPGYWEYVKINADDLTVDGISASDFLKYKELIFDQDWANDENAVEIDFGAIDFLSPRATLPSSIGESFVSTLPKNTPYHNFELSCFACWASFDDVNKMT
ncbi:hypothetical protein G4B88_005918 [Cannabis sativa]|uniref:sucrose synthase n=1 Tax=Cannabis sativa TaxID=3483 RepID=A0A7J6IAA2_CANSA|nr:hypothetical protein G4B88_005918 [Cannabis sativa]